MLNILGIPPQGSVPPWVLYSTPKDLDHTAYAGHSNVLDIQLILDMPHILDTLHILVNMDIHGHTGHTGHTTHAGNDKHTGHNTHTFPRFSASLGAVDGSRVPYTINS